MTIEIGDIIKESLEAFRVGGLGVNQFIDKLAGVIKTVVKTDLDKDNRPIRKTFPVACGMTYEECITNGNYKDLIPDDRIGCMVYLEDLGIRFVGRNGAKYVWKASYKMVGWVNIKKLGYEDCSITGKIITTIINKLSVSAFNSGIYQRIQIDVIGQDPKSYNPFSKFSYDEDKTQYLMYPFDYFSLPIEVSFEVHPSCITDFTKNTEITCN